MTTPILPLIADDQALDFLNSVAAPWGDQIDWLSDGQGLLGWLVQAGMLPPDAAQEIGKTMSQRDLDAAATKARSLRDWFRVLVSTQAANKADENAGFVEPDVLEKLNTLMSKGTSYRQLQHHKTGTDIPKPGRIPLPVGWADQRHWRNGADLLIPIAEAMGDFLCQANLHIVKNCEGPTCTLWFNDISKNHSRRWCMMSVCGNRAKAAAHRARSKSEAKPR